MNVCEPGCQLTRTSKKLPNFRFSRLQTAFSIYSTVLPIPTYLVSFRGGPFWTNDGKKLLNIEILFLFYFHGSTIVDLNAIALQMFCFGHQRSCLLLPVWEHLCRRLFQPAGGDYILLVDPIYSACACVLITHGLI